MLLLAEVVFIKTNFSAELINSSGSYPDLVVRYRGGDKFLGFGGTQTPYCQGDF